MAEKFVVGGVEHVTTMSNSNASYFRVVLSWVALGFDKSLYRGGVVDQGYNLLISRKVIELTIQMWKIHKNVTLNFLLHSEEVD